MLKAKMQSKFPLYFGFFMAMLYWIAAIYVIVSKDVNLRPAYRYLFSFILLCYGILRGYRGFNKYKKNVVESSL